MNNLLNAAKRLAGHAAVKNAALLYLVQISSFVFPLITLPYLSRILGPAKLGLLTAGQAFIWYFVTLTEYGFDLTATRRVAIQKEDPAGLSKIFSSVMMAKMLLTLVGFLIMLAVVFATPKLRANWPLYVISFLTVLGGLLFPMWLYQGVEKMGLVAARDFAAKLTGTVLVFLVVRQQSDYLWVAVFQSGAMALGGLVSLLMAPHICGVRFTLPSWKQIRTEYEEGWNVFLSMAALSLTGTNIVILSFVATETEVGYYTAAYRLVVALRGIAIPIIKAVYPYVSHKASKSESDAVRFLQRYAFLPVLPFLAGSLILVVAAPWVVQLVFGSQYEPTVLLLRIMAFSPFLLTVSNVYSTYFMLAFGYSKQWSRIVMQSTVLNYVLLGGLLWFMKPALAMAITFTAVDLFSVATAYLFYRKTAPQILARAQTAV